MSAAGIFSSCDLIELTSLSGFWHWTGHQQWIHDMLQFDWPPLFKVKSYRRNRCDLVWTDYLLVCLRHTPTAAQKLPSYTLWCWSDNLRGIRKHTVWCIMVGRPLMSLTWFEHLTFWSGERGAAIVTPSPMCSGGGGSVITFMVGQFTAVSRLYWSLYYCLTINFITKLL